MYRNWNGGGFPSFGFPWGALIMGVILVAFVAIVVIAVIRMSKTGRLNHEAATGRSIEILSERFARGEIDADTYRSMKTEIEKSHNY
jgi:putative membrane protein